jgi:hypothetical protein
MNSVVIVVLAAMLPVGAAFPAWVRAGAWNCSVRRFA